MEFILEGDPGASSGSGYLAVGANTGSNLRYSQYNNSRQLGFTQLGVADYFFNPGVPSPTIPTHIAYSWNAATKVVKLYVNGALAGTCLGVTADFALPSGQGYLGANPSNTEQMAGTFYRVTAYGSLLTEEAILRHADAYNEVVRLPEILAFAANPTTLLTPNTTELTWTVRETTGLWLNGTNVKGLTSLVLAPAETTTYTLVASNASGSVTAQTVVRVNPAPEIASFTASPAFVASGESILLSWAAQYGQSYFITPDLGDVTGQTVNGAGGIRVPANPPVTYTFTASNASGVATAQAAVQLIQAARHLVISEFMADDQSIRADEDGQYSGWIELHNPTAAAVNLAGYFLTDDPSEPMQWAFPAMVLAPDEYLVVFASGKDRAKAGAPLHVNFELGNNGEYLALVGPGPLAVHAYAPAYPAQRENISYGILADDPSFARYLGVPTPGAPNQESTPPPAAVRFTPESGSFTQPMTVTLTTVTPGALIRYTLDGSAPGWTHGTDYTAPIVLTNTAHFRAAALADGLISRLSGAVYLKLGADLANYTSALPIMVIDNFGAGTIPQKGWNSTGAGIKQVSRQTAVWATFDRKNGVSALTNAPQMMHTIGIRGRGAYSSQWRQKPYSVEAVDEENEEAKVAPLGMPAHADWVLYFPDPDADKDPAMLFNTFAYELSKKMGHSAARFRWVEAFVNENGGELRLADRRGVYAILEKVARGGDRLDFTRLSEDGNSGGWLLNINRMDPEPEQGWPTANGATQPWYFHTAGENRILETPANTAVRGDDEPQQSNGFLNFDNPNGYVINTNQRAAIERWFKQFEDVLWNNALWRNPTNGYAKYLDVNDFADYFILNVLTRNGDGLLISMFPWKGDDGKMRMGPAWDYNWSAYYISGGATGDLMYRSERLWYRRLFTDPDFLQLYKDRWWKMREGPLSNTEMEAIIDGQMADITPAKALLNGMPSMLEWTNRLSQMKTWLKTRADWIDSNYLRPPSFNTNGGEVPDGFQVVITGTNGTIYYTLNGSDPRAAGGAVASGAQAYQGPVPLQNQTLVRARVKNGSNWSGLATAVFYTPQDLSKLAITEIMYNPPVRGGWNGDELEFLELKNTGTNALHLGAMTYAAGINFTFTNGTRLGPGEFFVLGRNAAALASVHPGIVVHGIYTGKLDNGGETLRLATAQGNSVLAVTYQDRAPWPLAADGYGFSLVPFNSAGPDNSDNGTHWRASAAAGGSPGEDDPDPGISPVVINEILARPGAAAPAAIELFNPTAQSVDIGGWFLSDDGSAPVKYAIPAGTTISGGDYAVFTDAEFNPVPGTLNNFALKAAGGSLYLCSGNGAGSLSGYSHGISYGPAAAGVSFGRYLNSVGEELFPAQRWTTLGESNAGPLVGPVVIQEIHYHPPAIQTSAVPSIMPEEFVELRNITSQAVRLYDPAQPTNTWRIDGFGFAFPANLALPGNGLALVVAADPVQFRARYGVPAEVLVFGPASGTLQDSGERLQLQRPEDGGTNGLLYVVVDEVRYNDKAPWPPGADGGGPSLQRKAASAFGDDPVNWIAALPTPGADFSSGEPPTITAQPQDLVIVAWQEAVFSVTAAGQAPLYYQWLFDGAPLAGATNAVLRLTNAEPAQAGTYQAIVYNAAGSTTSAEARLVTVAPALITQQPLSVATNAGKTVKFSVAATGTGSLRYQWRKDGIHLTGATLSSLTLTNVQLANAGVYTVVITDDIGPITSAGATLVVLCEPIIVQAPLGQSVLPGARITLSVTVTNTATLPIGYRWRRNNANITGSFVVLTQYTAFFTITNAQWPYTNYVAVVTNRALPGGVLSPSAILAFVTDADGDGLPDVWESANGLNPTNAADRLLDTDGDGMLNWQEYTAGTDPKDAASYLRIDIQPEGAGARLCFGAASNKTYSVEYTDALKTGPWTRLADLPARATNHTSFLLDQDFHTNRFYRVVTPRRN